MTPISMCDSFVGQRQVAAPSFGAGVLISTREDWVIPELDKISRFASGRSQRRSPIIARNTPNGGSFLSIT